MVRHKTDPSLRKGFYRKRLEDGDFVADIIGDLRTEPHVYHYLVTRKGSREILTWMQEISLDAALDGAERSLAFFNPPLRRSHG